MKKNVFIGMDKLGKCCVLESLADFDQLCANSNDLSSDDFIHSSTNWSGCDDIERTLRIKGLQLTKRLIELPQPLFFSGEDHDWGLDYSWLFGVLYIYETEKKEGAHQ